MRDGTSRYFLYIGRAARVSVSARNNQYRAVYIKHVRPTTCVLLASSTSSLAAYLMAACSIPVPLLYRSRTLTDRQRDVVAPAAMYRPVEELFSSEGLRFRN